jgi:hypothetical protein
VATVTCPTCGAVAPAGSRYCPNCAAPQPPGAPASYPPARRKAMSTAAKALVVAVVVGVVAAVAVVIVLVVGVGQASNTITNALTPKAGRPSGYHGAGYPGMLVQDQVAAGAGASIDLYGETLTAGPLTRTPTILGPTLCSAVTIADTSSTTVSVGPSEWKLQEPNRNVVTFAINGSLQGGQIAPEGQAHGTVCFADSGQSGTFVLLWQPLLRIGRGVWLFHL